MRLTDEVKLNILAKLKGVRPILTVVMGLLAGKSAP